MTWVVFVVRGTWWCRTLCHSLCNPTAACGAHFLVFGRCLLFDVACLHVLVASVIAKTVSTGFPRLGIPTCFVMLLWRTGAHGRSDLWHASPLWQAGCSSVSCAGGALLCPLQGCAGCGKDTGRLWVHRQLCLCQPPGSHPTKVCFLIPGVAVQSDLQQAHDACGLNAPACHSAARI